MRAKTAAVGAISYLIQGVVILSLSLALMVGALELWARVQPRRYFVEFDPLLGFRNEPGATGVYRGRWFLKTNPAIDSPISINKLGLRGPEREPEKAKGVRRLVVLGDSFVQAFEVPWDDAFYAKLEVESRARTGVALETFPMGVNGFGQAQQMLWLRRDGISWDPDFVLLVVFLGNDLTDNSSEIGAGASRPYFDLVDGELVQVGVPSDSARMKYWIADHFRAYLLFRELAVRFDGLKDVARRLGWVNTAELRRRGPSGDGQRLAKAWNLTFALIEEIERTSREAGAGFGLAYHGTFPTGDDEDDRTRMARFCRRATIECVDLSKQLDTEPENFIPDDEHWTARGHARVAEMIWDRWGKDLTGIDR